ncbi:hypothetical protein [Thermomonas sp.]|uniref:hypothetical protein n=1 Tax=Thermomonas sp. TaxID=1971895 RepID=UPI00261F7307|nr:hypothetical protein [Thermomonas sp.]
MAYVTGSAASMSALLSALQGACTANGWTLSGNVLHKGSCYADLKLGQPGYSYGAPPVNGYLRLVAGNGIDGSNNITDAAPGAVFLGPLRQAAYDSVPLTWSFPIEYHIHVLASPDEVWLWVRYETDYWQYMAFGRSPAPGCGGSGNWSTALIGSTLGRGDCYDNVCSGSGNGVSGVGYGSISRLCSIPFWWNQNSYSSGNGFVHGVIDNSSGAARWNVPLFATDHGAAAWLTLYQLYNKCQSVWNDEAVLCPIQLAQQRPSNKISIIAEMQHARLTRNLYLQPGEIVALGLDKWKVYPTYRRNTDVTGDIAPGGGVDGASHSGTFAIAVRYDGP